MKNTFSFFVVSLMIFFFTAKSFSQEIVLDSTMIHAELKERGMKVSAKHIPLGIEVDSIYSEDGTIKSLNSNKAEDKGKWEINPSDNFLVINYEVWPRGCFKVVKKSDKLFFYGCRSGREIMVEK